MYLTSLSYQELVDKGVSKPFARIISDPESYHEYLGFYVGKTAWDYFIPEGVTDVVPLWDCNADSYVRWERDGAVEYVLLFHDDPEWALIARSEQGIIAHLWQSWVGSCEEEEEFRKFAEALGFLHYKEAMQIWDKDFDAFDEWKLNPR